MAGADQKKQLIEQCKELLQNQIDILTKEISSLSDSRNSETKSSAGDKYETSRAMMQQELDKLEQKRAETNYRLIAFSQIQFKEDYVQVEKGSLILTNEGTYFISISLGKLALEGEKYYVLSPDAPLSKVVLGKNKGDKLVFNNREIIILDVI